MNLFTISQMEQFSGIKTHTIRIWEKRYNGLSPDRSEGKTRHYSDEQLRRLLNIVSLMHAGHKPSELCRMPDSGLFRLLDDELKNPVGADNNYYEYFISQLIGAGMNFDEIYFDKVLSSCMLRVGVKDTYRFVIYPLLVRVGLLWSKNSVPPGQEHFISNLIRQKLFTALDSLPPALSGRQSWLLFLPENELHEIGLLFSHYLIRQARYPSFYLGSDVPLGSLGKAVTQIKPDNILLFIVSHVQPENLQEYLDALPPVINHSNLYVAAKKELHPSTSGQDDHVRYFHAVQQLETVLYN